MRALENIIAVFCVVLLLGVLVTVRSAHYTESCEATAESLVSSFLAEIRGSGEITRLSYELCTERLYKIGYEGDFSITVTEYETDLGGNIYRYVTTWDEILEEIENEGAYKCPAGSCVKVAVGATDERISQTFRRAFFGLKSFTKVEYVKEKMAW